MIRTARDGRPSVIAALAAAAVLLAAGVLMAIYQEQLYSSQQVRSVREQAQILAGSVTAAVVFDDHNAAQEYVDALRVNPELEGAGIYNAHGQLMAGFARGTRLPALVAEPGTSLGPGYIDITAPVNENADKVGTVLLRAVTEPAGTACRPLCRVDRAGHHGRPGDRGAVLLPGGAVTARPAAGQRQPAPA